MIHFENYTKKTLKKYSKQIHESPYLINDISLGTLFAWKKRGGLKLANFKDTFFVSQNYGFGDFFSYPYGKNVSDTISELIKYCEKENLPLRFYGVIKDILPQIENHPEIKNITYSYNRNWSDYLYSIDEIATFSGKKFAGQRNHINKFNTLYKNAVFSPLTRQDFKNVYDMLSSYDQTHKKDKMYKLELKNTYKLLENIDYFGFLAFKTEIDGKIASFTIGEVVNKTLVIHVEKALREFSGVYPYTFNNFAKFVKENYPQVEFINREDDSGVPGLRTSKMQYQPITLIDKYFVFVNNPIKNVDYEHLPDKEISIDKILEEDKASYNRLCLDNKLNKYWGYDYTADIDKNAVTFDTFYDMQKQDFENKESMSFAIRLNGEFIGETILYNFTSNQIAELGIRLLPEYQGKGFGKRAYILTRDFAIKNGLKIISKCFKQNIASKNALLSSGMKLVKEDKKYYYFEY